MTHYDLMLADADGYPDEDFGMPLGASQPIKKFGTATFAMLKKAGQGQDAADETPLFKKTNQINAAFNDFRVLRIT